MHGRGALTRRSERHAEEALPILAQPFQVDLDRPFGEVEIPNEGQPDVASLSVAARWREADRTVGCGTPGISGRCWP